MWKRAMFLILAVAGCDVQTPAEPLTSNTPAAVAGVTEDAIFRAANTLLPIDASNGLTIAIPDRDRTEHSRLVTYENDREWLTYQFNNVSGKWLRADLVDAGSFDRTKRSDIGAQSTGYSGAIAQIRN